MKVSKGMFLGIMGGGLVAGVVLVFIGIGAAIMGAAAAGNNDSGANAAAAGGMGIAMLGYLCFLATGITYVILLYKAWSAVNDGQARTTPGVAVGFLFIPFFNLYWIFQAVWGWAQDYNKYIVRHAVAGAPQMNEQLFLFQPIAQLACIVPLVNFLAGPAYLVLLFLNASKMIDGVNALAGSAPRAMVATAGQ